MKTCPFCGESIQIAAIKCRYCGEWLDGREAPSAVDLEQLALAVAAKMQPATSHLGPWSGGGGQGAEPDAAPGDVSALDDLRVPNDDEEATGSSAASTGSYPGAFSPRAVPHGAQTEQAPGFTARLSPVAKDSDSGPEAAAAGSPRSAWEPPTWLVPERGASLGAVSDAIVRQHAVDTSARSPASSQDVAALPLSAPLTPQVARVTEWSMPAAAGAPAPTPLPSHSAPPVWKAPNREQADPRAQYQAPVSEHAVATEVASASSMSSVRLVPRIESGGHIASGGSMDLRGSARLAERPPQSDLSGQLASPGRELGTGAAAPSGHSETLNQEASRLAAAALPGSAHLGPSTKPGRTIRIELAAPPSLTQTVAADDAQARVHVMQQLAASQGAHGEATLGAADGRLPPITPSIHGPSAPRMQSSAAMASMLDVPRLDPQVAADGLRSASGRDQDAVFSPPASASAHAAVGEVGHHHEAATSLPATFVASHPQHSAPQLDSRDAALRISSAELPSALSTASIDPESVAVPARAGSVAEVQAKTTAGDAQTDPSEGFVAAAPARASAPKSSLESAFLGDDDDDDDADDDEDDASSVDMSQIAAAAPSRAPLFLAIAAVVLGVGGLGALALGGILKLPGAQDAGVALTNEAATGGTENARNGTTGEVAAQPPTTAGATGPAAATSGDATAAAATDGAATDGAATDGAATDAPPDAGTGGDVPSGGTALPPGGDATAGSGGTGTTPPQNAGTNTTPAKLAIGVPTDPAAFAAKVALAQRTYQKGKLNDTKAAAIEALAMAANHPEALVLLSQAHLELGELDEALTSADLCVSVAADNVDCWLTIAVVTQEQKNDARAILAWKQYLELAPTGKYAANAKKNVARLQARVDKG